MGCDFPPQRWIGQKQHKRKTAVEFEVASPASRRHRSGKLAKLAVSLAQDLQCFGKMAERLELEHDFLAWGPGGFQASGHDLCVGFSQDNAKSFNWAAVKEQLQEKTVSAEGRV